MSITSVFRGDGERFTRVAFTLFSRGSLSFIPVDLYIIHLIFLPVIQKQLNLFKDGWANHPLRTEGNQTPLHSMDNGPFSNRVTKPKQRGSY